MSFDKLYLVTLTLSMYTTKLYDKFHLVFLWSRFLGSEDPLPSSLGGPGSWTHWTPVYYIPILYRFSMFSAHRAVQNNRGEEHGS
jgi:hypothetical protein